MQRRTLNLGILAHVDAGKTTLTERLLFTAGVIDSIGSVDAGTTQTDSLELERERGITIRSAAVSFSIDDVTVNVIDTPGHPDFIAEVERVLAVLDGAVLVLSAVEGVQPQTRTLMRALQRLRIPTLLFVNKIDRPGAGYERVLGEISARLTTGAVPMGRVFELGSRAATFIPWLADDAGFRATLIDALAERDDALLAAYLEDEAAVTDTRLRDALAAQTKRAQIRPVFFGSAITGAGVDALMSGLVELLPVAVADADGPVAGGIFKIERGPAGEKVAYARLFSGTLHARDRVRFGEGVEEKITAIKVLSGSGARPGPLRAGEIGKLWGLGKVRVGDAIGERRASAAHHFAPPTMETVVVARQPEQARAMRVALALLAEQDPLINVCQDDISQEVTVSLYGEVQKEVLEATLARDFGIDVAFHETTTLCIERPAGMGEAVERLHAESNPFLATLGFRIQPAPRGSGIEFRLGVDPPSMPLFIYKSVDAFAALMDQYVRQTLQEGLYGWQITDCTVTLFECAYSTWDGPPSARGPNSTAADFRKLTPLVLMEAVRTAGTVVCEPILRVTLEIPTRSLASVLSAVARLGGAVEVQSPRGEYVTVRTTLPASRVQILQRHLSGLTGGEGLAETAFAGYEKVAGDAPRRRRTTVARSDGAITGA